jgi:hypothetical protein
MKTRQKKMVLKKKRKTIKYFGGSKINCHFTAEIYENENLRTVQQIAKYLRLKKSVEDLEKEVKHLGYNIKLDFYENQSKASNWAFVIAYEIATELNTNEGNLIVEILDIDKERYYNITPKNKTFLEMLEFFYTDSPNKNIIEDMINEEENEIIKNLSDEKIMKKERDEDIKENLLRII